MLREPVPHALRMPVFVLRGCNAGATERTPPLDPHRDDSRIHHNFMTFIDATVGNVALPVRT